MSWSVQQALQVAARLVSAPSSGGSGGAASALSGVASSASVSSISPSPVVDSYLAKRTEGAFFRIAHSHSTLDLSSQALELELDKDFSEVGKNRFSLALEIWNVTQGLSAYPLFEIKGAVEKSGAIFSLSIAEARRHPKSDGIAMEREPFWESDPVFGSDARISIKEREGVTIGAGGELSFRLPTFRFGEMKKTTPDDHDDLETITLQVGGMVDNKPEISGRINVSYSKQSAMMAQEITAIQALESDQPDPSKKQYSNLQYTADPNAIPADKRIPFNSSYRKDRIPSRKNQHLDSIVIHCTSAIGLVGAWNNTGDNSDRLNDSFDIDESILAIQQRPSGYTGAHYIIGREGHIVELARPRERVSHAGISNSSKRTNFMLGNTRSVGIELIGFYDSIREDLISKYSNFKSATGTGATKKKTWAAKWEEFMKANDPELATKETPTEADFTNENAEIFKYTKAQYKALGALLRVLGKRYGYIRICTHKWLVTNKSDPGTKFDFEQIRDYLPDNGAFFAASIDGQSNTEGFMVAGYDKISGRRNV